MKKIFQLIYTHIIAQICEFYAGETLPIKDNMFNYVQHKQSDYMGQM